MSSVDDQQESYETQSRETRYKKYDTLQDSLMEDNYVSYKLLYIVRYMSP